MPSRINFMDGSEYSAIILKASQPARSRYCFTAEVYKGKAKSSDISQECEIAKKVFYESLDVSDINRPISQHLCSTIVNLVEKKKLTVSVVRDVKGKLCVYITNRNTSTPARL